MLTGSALDFRADSEVFDRLFCVSRTAQLWTLQHAPDATLRFELYGDESPNARQRQLAAARAALTARGRLPTKLSVWVFKGPANECIAAAIPSFLWQVGQGITRLEFDCSSEGATELGTLFMRCLAPSVPNLTTLTLSISACAMPTPPALPLLTELTMSKVPQHCCASIAPYLTQITALNIDPQHNIDEAAFFTALITTHTTTLTSLETDAGLSDALLGLLLAHAPALTELCVGPVTVTSDQHRGKQWGVKQLHTLAYAYHYLARR